MGNKSIGIKSKHLYIRQYEFVGDAFLNYHAKCYLIKKYPNSPLKVFEQVGKLVSNEILQEFAKQNSLNDANTVEIIIGMFLSQDKENKAKLLIEKVIDFGLSYYKMDKDFNKLYEPVASYSFEQVSKKKKVNLWPINP